MAKQQPKPNEDKPQESDAMELRMKALESQNETLSKQLNDARKAAEENESRVASVLERTEKIAETVVSKQAELEQALAERDKLKLQQSENPDAKRNIDLEKQLAATKARLDMIEAVDSDPEVINAKRNQYAKRLADRVAAVLNNTRSRVNTGKHQYRVKLPHMKEKIMNSEYDNEEDFRAKALPQRIGDNRATHVKVSKVA